MVVRRDDSITGKMGKKIARTLVAGIAIVPGVLSNPLLIDHNTSFADSPLTFPSTMYVGQHLDVRNYVTSEAFYLDSSASVVGDGPVLIGLVYDSSNDHLVAELPGTYTIYIYEYPEGEDSRESTVDITVKYPDFNDDGVDIGDLVEYITTHSEVVGESGGFSSEQVNDMLCWIDYKNIANQAPEPVLSSELSTEVFMNVTAFPTWYFNLDSNSYVTDHDEDFLTYKIESVSPANSVKAWIQGTSVVMSPGSVPADSTVTVRAYDGHGGTVDLKFTVDMNFAPVPISSLEINVHSSGAQTINLSNYFSDPEGDSLTYSVNSPSYIEDNILYYNAYTSDSGRPIDVRVMDDYGSFLDATFTVTYTTPVDPE